MDLVTGATGFIGSHILYHLVKMNRNVRALFRNAERIEQTSKIFGYYEGDPSPLMTQIEWVECDVTDYHALMELTKDVTCVFHAAGAVSFTKYGAKMADLVNTGGTANIVNACLENRTGRLCHVSSIAVLGDSGDGQLIDETVISKPGSSHSLYSLSKYKGEMEVWRGIQEGLNAIIVNPSLVIGPGLWFSAGAPLLTRVYKGLNFYPGGGCGYIDVRDVAGYMIRLADSNIGGGRFILNSENMMHRDFINLVADAMGRRRPKYRVSKFIGHAACMAEAIHSWLSGVPPAINREALRIAEDKNAYSNRKILEAFGGSFISVQDTVRDMVRIFLQEMNGK